MAFEGVTRRAATAVMIGCAVLVIATLLLWVPAIRRVTIPSKPAPGGYHTGELVDLPGFVAGGPPTVVLFGRSTCGACERSAKFFQDTLDDAAARGAKVIVAIPAGNGAGDLEYVTNLGRTADMQAVDFDALSVRTLPTVLVADSRGRILFAREGAPSVLEQPGVRSSIVTAVLRR